MKTIFDRRIGKNMQNALLFANNYPGWHSFNCRCRATKDAIKRLAKRGLVEINKYEQYRSTKNYNKYIKPLL